jgi:hypothetical protein
MMPYLQLAKIVAGFALLASVLFAGHQVAEHWREQGRVEVQTKWDAEKTAIHLAEQKAIQKRNENNAKLLLIYETRNQENIREYERRIELQNRDNARDIAALKSHGGLRLPSTFCSGFAPQASTASTERDNGESGSRLPEQIENDLLQFAEDRDKEIILLDTCQNWIRDNGLFTPTQH